MLVSVTRGLHDTHWPAACANAVDTFVRRILFYGLCHGLGNIFTITFQFAGIVNVIELACAIGSTFAGGAL